MYMYSNLKIMSITCFNHMHIQIPISFISHNSFVYDKVEIQNKIEKIYSTLFPLLLNTVAKENVQKNL